MARRRAPRTAPKITTFNNLVGNSGPKMSTPSYEEIISSQTFQFLVGPKKRLFTVHSALVACQSPALNTLVTGKFAEAEDGQAVLAAVDEQTFVRFSQFAYTGDYNEKDAEIEDVEVSPGDTTQKSVEQPANIESYAEEWDSYHDTYVPVSRAGISTKRKQQWDAFTSAEYLDSRPFLVYKPRRGNGRRENYTDIFLSNARLYTFAECYGILPLMELSIHKLHKTLVNFELFEERVGDVVELFRFCFENGAPDTLRKLLVQYAGCKVEKLWESEDFRKLVGESGDLSVALVASMLPGLG